MTSSGDEFEIRAVVKERAEMDQVSELFREVWPEGHVHRHEFLDWLYFQNPCGDIIGMNAWHGDTLAAHYVVTPIRAVYQGSKVKAALSLNTVTHPAFQRRGLFVRLAEATYASAKDGGVHHVIGVSNANSTPGFVGRLGFQKVGQLDVRIGLDLPAFALETPAPDPCWRRSWEDDDLVWRLRNPAASYRRQGDDRCMSVLASTGTLGIQAILMLTNDAARVRVIRQSLGRQVGVGPRMWMGLSRRVLPAPISLPLPEVLKKSPLNLVFRPLADPACALDPATVEFEAIDFDAY